MNDGNYCNVIGVGRNEHVAALDAQSAENYLECSSAAIHGDSVLGAEIIGEAPLEFLSVGAECQAAAGENFLDAVGDPLPVFGGEVDARRRYHADWRTL